MESKRIREKWKLYILCHKIKYESSVWTFHKFGHWHTVFDAIRANPHIPILANKLPKNVSNFSEPITQVLSQLK